VGFFYYLNYLKKTFKTTGKALFYKGFFVFRAKIDQKWAFLSILEKFLSN